jgi:hypothetical protein
VAVEEYARFYAPIVSARGPSPIDSDSLIGEAAASYAIGRLSGQNANGWMAGSMNKLGDTSLVSPRAGCGTRAIARPPMAPSAYRWCENDAFVVVRLPLRSKPPSVRALFDDFEFRVDRRSPRSPLWAAAAS